MARPGFVARERELQRLDRFLEAALGGQGQVCFVSGEAGSGKTALLTEFARRAEAQHPELVAALGQGDAQTGIGDPYLPFREVLSQLTGDVDTGRTRGVVGKDNANRLRNLVTMSGQILVEMAPDLVGLFVPGAGLVMRAALVTADKTGWLEKVEKLAQRPKPGEGLGGSGLEQNLVFEQYTRFLTTLAGKKPLLLLLDDLQWADPSSLALLFRLARRIGLSRILLAGSYRPEEVAQDYLGGRHPLEKVIAELKRYQGQVELSLDQTEEADRRGFVDCLLDSEPNTLDDGFRQALLQHTDGHALFTVELLRAMQERGDLVQDTHGRWTTGSTLNWTSFPARVEGVIEERIGRLAEELRAALTVACVEGEQFTAEVVAQVRAVDARDLVRRLSEDLQKEHRLVSAQGVRRLEARRLALYRFQHNLFQKYLYNGMDAVERAYLHEDVGNVLELLYGEQTDEVAVQLARHFEEAGVAAKAARYLRRSGELTAARYANEEAVAYFSRALALLSETDLAGRYTLLLAREEVYHLTGQRDAQRRDLAELEPLAQGMGAEQQAEAAVRRARYSGATGNPQAQQAAAQVAVERAQVAGNAGLEAMGHLLWGLALATADWSAMQAQLEEAVALARDSGLYSTEARALLGLAYQCRFRGDTAGEQGYLEQALLLYRRTGNQVGEAHSLLLMGDIPLQLGDFAAALAYYEQSLGLTREIGWRQVEGSTLGRFCLTYYLLGDYTQALGCGEQHLSISHEIGDRYGEGETLAYLAMVSRCLGEYGRAREYGEQALLLAREICEPMLEGEVLLALGDVYHDMGDLATARVHYEQALHLRRQIGVAQYAVVEVRAGLARVNLALGDLAQAQATVGEILAYLDAGSTLLAWSRPLRTYLFCYKVLLAAGDPRAPEILTPAHRLLQEQAGRIPDEALRRSFLENVAENREIVAEFARWPFSSATTKATSRNAAR